MMMPSILLKNVPLQLHRRLKLRAAAERRSLQQEAILALERGVSLLPGGFRHNTLPPPTPVRMKVPLTNAFLEEMKRERDAHR
jgi:hypothetical protein